jgi:small neutral amino acid transporter SnatA (MarC family)
VRYDFVNKHTQVTLSAGSREPSPHGRLMGMLPVMIAVQMLPNGLEAYRKS